jgi:hypothetical protein
MLGVRRREFFGVRGAAAWRAEIVHRGYVA